MSVYLNEEGLCTSSAQHLRWIFFAQDALVAEYIEVKSNKATSGLLAEFSANSSRLSLLDHSAASLLYLINIEISTETGEKVVSEFEYNVAKKLTVVIAQKRVRVTIIRSKNTAPK